MGVYEPIVMLMADGDARLTSLLAESQINTDGTVLHKKCYEQASGQTPEA